MKSPVTKIAAAAVIIIAVLVGLLLFSSGTSSVVLADVLERIEQTGAFTYKMKMTITGAVIPDAPVGKHEMEGTFTVSNDYGMKWDMTTIIDANSDKEMTQQMYIIPSQKVMITLMPDKKRYIKMEFDDDFLDKTKKQNNDPREMIKQMLGTEYTELGRSEINGIEVEGFETTDPNYSMGVVEDIKTTLWVDVKTWLPVLWEMDMKMNEQMTIHGVFYDFQWNVPVVASDFEPVIPEDYTSMMEDGYKMPSMTEEAAIEGLKLFAEVAGNYPTKLDLMTLMQEFSDLEISAIDSDNLTEAGKKLDEEIEQLTIDEQTKKAIERMRPIQSLGMFYMMLGQDKKEPAYYGQSVGPDDTEKVLLRWKVSDNEYRVIFGDLSTLNVSADELANLGK